jgi:Holliday junction resolvase RusA-like endonuclease
MIFEIPNFLVPQKQTQFDLRGKRPIAYNPNKRDIDKLRYIIRPQAPKKLICEPVELTIHFFFPIPKNTSLKRRIKMLKGEILPDKRPDEDNLAYLVSNALQGIIYDDDKRVCVKHVYKKYGEFCKTVIEVRTILI